MADDVVVQIFEQAGAVVQIVEDGVVVQTIDVPTPVVLVETFGFTAHNALDIVSLEAAQALGGHRVVLAAGGNTVDYASSANAGHAGKVIGITTGAVNGGAEADVRVSGEMIDGPSHSCRVPCSSMRAACLRRRHPYGLHSTSRNRGIGNEDHRCAGNANVLN
jgi:hypothetical protein